MSAHNYTIPVRGREDHARGAYNTSDDSDTIDLTSSMFLHRDSLSSSPRGLSNTIDEENVIDLTTDEQEVESIHYSATAASSSDICEDVVLVGHEHETPTVARKARRRKRNDRKPEHSITRPSVDVAMENRMILDKLYSSLKCAICLDPIKNMSSTTCGHVFCRVCAIEAIRIANKCPLCKKFLRQSDVHPVYL